MDSNYSPDLITLLDEDGRELTLEILDIYEENERVFYALMPVYDNKEDLLYDSGEYTILEVVDENSEEQLAEVEDEELKLRLSRIFEDRFNDMFYED
ncbi:MAG: DUF1292 domain-containing protein [Ruminococcus sp.]|nr:DUF1292 domain-containing protein [Ruminococcus sp.]